MKLSVIIPGFGPRRSQSLEQAERIRRGLKGVDAEVLVPDGTNVSVARNRGLDEAQGEWIAWVDGDDEVYTSWYDTMRSIASGNHDVDMVVLSYRLLCKNRETDFIADDALSNRECFMRELLSDVVCSYCYTKVIRSEFWKDVRFDGSLTVLEDFIAVPNVVAKVRRIDIEKIPAYGYIVHDDSLSNERVLGHRSEEVIRAAIRRAREWVNTEYADYAVVGTAMQCEQYLEKAELLGLEVPPFGKVPQGFIRRYLLKMIFGKTVGWRRKIKLLSAATGWWWPQKLAWQFHGVTYECR